MFLTKNALFGYFWARILKKLLSYLKSAPSNLSICKISRKNKNAYIWDQICLFCVFLGWNLKTILSYLKSAPSNLSKCKIHETMQRPKFESKNTWFGYFWVRIWKNYRDIQNQHRRICLIAKFCEKTNKNKKWLNLRPGMLDLGILGQKFENYIAIFEISTREFV